MKIIIINVMLLVGLIVSCGQNYNSNSFDKDKYSNAIDLTTPEGQRLFLAYNVIKDKCISCHTGYHNTYSSYTTSDQWKSSGLIVAGDFAGSLLRNKLQNFSGNMPASGSALTAQEVTYLQDWVDGL